VVKNESGSRVEAKCCRPAKDLWLAGHRPLFSLLSLLLSSYLSQPPQLGDKLESFWPHGLTARPPTLAGWPHLGSPIKGLTRGASSFIPQAHKQPQISLILLQVLSSFKLVYES
jgi:hypothetical protein